MNHRSRLKRVRETRLHPGYSDLDRHQSAGELENDEHTAGVMMQMVRTASRFRLSGSADPPFRRMSGNAHAHTDMNTQTVIHSPVSALPSVVLEDFVYTLTVSGQKVYVVKRQNNQQEPVSV